MSDDEAFWGFRQRLEAYTPAPKRVYGYFSLAILHHDRLVGRFDPKLERATLPNGLKVILAERHDVPIVELDLLVDAGYAADQCKTLHADEVGSLVLATDGKGNWKVVTDLQDLEDGPGGMDFKVGGTRQVVRGHHNCASFCGDCFQHFVQHGGCILIETGIRLIEEHHVRIVQHSPPDG